MTPGPTASSATRRRADAALGFQRRIEIRELVPVNPDLRELVITITYTVGPAAAHLHAAHLHLRVLVEATCAPPDIRAGRDGFTLVELLVAMGIVLVIMGGR